MLNGTGLKDGLVGVGTVPPRWSRVWNMVTGRKAFIVVALVPALLILGVFVLLPVLYSAFLSLFDAELLTPTQFVGLQHYIDAFTNPIFWTALLNTLYYAAGSVLVTCVLGLMIALLLNRIGHLKSLYRTIFFAPYVIPYAAFVLAWDWMFDPRFGFVNYLLSLVGVPAIPWLTTPSWVIPAFILMSVWKRLGFAAILFLVGLETIPQTLYDAARVDGAGWWSVFRHVTLPLLRPITLFIVVVSLTYSLQLFIEPLVMTKGGPSNASVSIVYLLYQEFGSLNIGSASAIAINLIVLIFGISIVLLKGFDVGEVYG